MSIGDRKEREEYMDGLERQMEVQRERIRRTLDRMEGSGRRRTALERLRGSLPRFSGRAPAQGDPEETCEDAPQSRTGAIGGVVIPPDVGRGPESASERPWWRRFFGFD